MSVTRTSCNLTLIQRTTLRGGSFFVIDIPILILYTRDTMTIEEKREKNRLKNLAWRKLHRKKCCNSTAAWRVKHPNYERDRKWNERYGITPDHYNQMVLIQNNCCAICGKPETAVHNKTKKVQKLAVDHNHETGEVRGLLCQDCNRGLGKFHENITSLENAIKYLRKFQS